MFERVLGPDHPNVATTLNNQALLLSSQVRVQGNSLEVWRNVAVVLAAALSAIWYVSPPLWFNGKHG